MTRLSFLFVLLGAVSLVAAEVQLSPYKPSSAETQFTAALDTTTTFLARVSVARAFQQNHPIDAGVQLRAADLLALDDPAAVVNYYADRAKANPRSEIDLYIAGRYSPALADKQAYVAKIFSADPQSYWGHLLQATAYPAEDDPDFAKAEAALLRAIALDNSRPYAPTLLGELWARSGKTAPADQLFVEMAKQSPHDFDPVQRRLMLFPGDFKKHLSILDGFLDKNTDDVLALDVRARVCRELNDWNGYIAAMRKAVAKQPDAVNHYNLACGYALTGQKDSSYAHLFPAAELGLNDTEQYTEDEDLIPVRDDARWSELLVAVETSKKKELVEMAQATRRELPAEEKKQLVENRSDQPAPDFTLEKLSGGTVKLSELRGKVVVIDFWATWCGPCKMTMPLIEQYYKNRPDGVEVYGINVWERNGTDKVASFIQNAGYTFPILFGKDETAGEYAVRGIPTMFVIDKDGKIAHRHVGYNPQIAQILAAQVTELLK
ncbi:MAG: redoxin domain-containing protein [bacterium]|nr:redoxin domain-containing protein [bacterium]